MITRLHVKGPAGPLSVSSFYIISRCISWLHYPRLILYQHVVDSEGQISSRCGSSSCFSLSDTTQCRRAQVTKATTPEHKASLTHELVVGAACYLVSIRLNSLRSPSHTCVPKAAKAYEDYCAKNGKPDTHAEAKELLSACSTLSARALTHTLVCSPNSAAVIGAFIDNIIETKGV